MTCNDRATDRDLQSVQLLRRLCESSTCLSDSHASMQRVASADASVWSPAACGPMQGVIWQITRRDRRVCQTGNRQSTDVVASLSDCRRAGQRTHFLYQSRTLRSALLSIIWQRYVRRWSATECYIYSRQSLMWLNQLTTVNQSSEYCSINVSR